MSWLYIPELLSRAVPRYTSYPTAADFGEGVGRQAQAGALRAVLPEEKLSIYVHIPFCDQLCWYCGCNTGANNRPERLRAYVSALVTEIATVASHLDGRGLVRSVHFGGGTPNVLPLDWLVEILRALRAHLPGVETASLALEADPRALDDTYCAGLAHLGFERISLGVQTFAPHVQAAINRIQPVDMIAANVDALRRHGLRHINFDLMYGLPRQTLADLSQTLDAALDFAPDRIALFGYAHLPAALPRQRKISDADLPDAQARFRQSELAFETLTARGYSAIGFDHFARPDDRLAIAAREGALRRNFQGFTDDQATTLIGLGATAISQFGTLMVQNEKATGAYTMRAAQGRLAGQRGVVIEPEDKLRGAVIEALLCSGQADVGMAARAAGWPGSALDDGLAALAPLAAQGLVRVAARDVLILGVARPYARLVANAFDARHGAHAQRFSKAV